MGRPATTVAFLAGLLAACAGSSSDPPPEAPPAEPSRASRFADCAALGAYLAKTAAEQGALATAYPAVRNDATDGTVTGAPTAGAAPEAGSRDHSSTTIQEEGVDEPDFVKTDGDSLYLVTGGYLLVFDAWPPAETAERARVAIDGDPLALFVHGSTVLVLSQSWQAPAAGAAVWGGWGARLKATLVTLADRAAPSLRREITFEGAYLDARLVDGRAHLVFTSWLPALSGGAPPPPRVLTAAGGAEPALVSAPDPPLPTADATELLPRVRDTLFGPGDPVTREGAICPCENIFRPPTPNGTGFVTVATLDLARPTEDLETTSLISNSGIVYASQTSLYLATPNDDYWLWRPTLERPEAEPRPTTLVHKFDLAGTPTYAASGVVPGWVLNQFSMGEHEGVFRIATTAHGWWRRQDPENAVFLLRQAGEKLQELGAVTGLGKPGERIYAVRFLGDRGFVVTFRQTDPLYALDLGDPAAPRVAGELHVPGFSTYLHPVADDLLLAVGEDEARGVKLSLYDVSDLDRPREVGTEAVGLGSFSEAQYNHKAFTYFPRLGALALPVTTWAASPVTDASRVSNVFAGLHLYDVRPDAASPEAVFALRGRIDHTAFYRDDPEGYWYYPEPVRRTFFIGAPGADTFLYTVSGRGLKVTAFDDLTEDVAALPLPAPETRWRPMGR